MKTVVDLVTALKEYFLGKDKDVEKIIAPVETDATSSVAAHAIGDQIIVDNVLYNVTAAIAVGDSLTVGTNISRSDSVVKQLKTINTTLGATDISGVGNSVTAAISSLNSNLTNTNNQIGNTDISAIGNSVTSAISSLNNDLTAKTHIGSHLEQIDTIGNQGQCTIHFNGIVQLSIEYSSSGIVNDWVFCNGNAVIVQNIPGDAIFFNSAHILPVQEGDIISFSTGSATLNIKRIY